MALVEIGVLARTSFENRPPVGKRTRKKVIENYHENQGHFQQHFDINLAPKSSDVSYEMLQIRWFELRRPSKSRISQTSLFLIIFNENHEKLCSRVGASHEMTFSTYREQLLFSSIQNARLSSRAGHSSIFVMFACVQKNNMLMLCFWKTAKTHGFHTL